ncbi:MAG TPA: hypothetical protein VNO84_13710 [Burkholderiaceae bacterium]|nr:hypothetical protein [Burkholderiaceae bacterium]
MASNDFGNSHWSMMIEQFSGTARPVPAARRKSPTGRTYRADGQPAEAADQELRTLLMTVVQHMRERRMDLIEERALAPLLALDWIEWHGGALRLTITGSNVCEQMRQYGAATEEPVDE